MKRIILISAILLMPIAAQAQCGNPYSYGCSQQQTFDALQRQQQQAEQQAEIRREMWLQQQQQLQQQQELQIQQQQLEQMQRMNNN